MIDLGTNGMEFEGWDDNVPYFVLRWLLSYALPRLGSLVIRRLRRVQLGRRQGPPPPPSPSDASHEPTRDSQ